MRSALVLVFSALLPLGCGGSGGATDAGPPDLPPLPDTGPTSHLSSIGDPCSTGKDCKGISGALCWTMSLGGSGIRLDFPNGYCTLPCIGQASCPADAECIVPPGETIGGCLRRCLLNDECRTSEGYCCVPDPLEANTAICADPGSRGYCAPN